MRDLKIRHEDLLKPLGVTTRGAVGHYLTGRRPITAMQFAALARELKMSMDELMGNGNGNIVELRRRPGSFNAALLKECGAGIDQGLAGLKVPIDRKWDLILGLYELLNDSGGKPTRSTIQQFIRRAV